ncbi:related to CSM3 Protein required for accurate chromosome segregation during meiosis [Phialocephala subalpina]|uniref:Chromosome segregation in meiosis protein n=1 Tax=Phialocephala subalpina TaxID=576137 RepID=A0A1L7XD19_9HELO|nr:related to CSM3 Protein required for accurate chromosome segregation during meiosis [Phialocephala subalpina]
MSDTETRTLPTGGPTAGGDELDDLFNYGVDDEDDPFSENYVSSKAKERQRKADEEKAKQAVDAEVEITRKPRAPRVRLDENRLLSANGIPKLRNRAKHHLKFKGKGHEYSDAARLLSFYQLWLDDLFPKARFLDALAMVEKMGHKKRMQMMRMEWINEGKPKPDNDDLFDEPTLPARENGEREKDVPLAPIFEKRASERPKTPEANADVDVEMDDLYNATPRAARKQPAEVTASQNGTSIFGNATTAPAVEDEPFDDDLDALLAEEEMLQATSGNAQPVPAISKTIVAESGFDDDEEAAMAEMDMW